jgi:hypothetical protein
MFIHIHIDIVNFEKSNHVLTFLFKGHQLKSLTQAPDDVFFYWSI